MFCLCLRLFVSSPQSTWPTLTTTYTAPGAPGAYIVANSTPPLSVAAPSGVTSMTVPYTLYDGVYGAVDRCSMTIVIDGTIPQAVVQIILCNSSFIIMI